MPSARQATLQANGMTPVHFLARLAALVPPPRFPLLRFAGVLAPSSPWRAAVVPGPRSVGAGGTCVNPSAGDRKAAKPKGAKGKSATMSPTLAPHDRPEQVAPAAPPGAARGPRTSLGAGLGPQPFARIDWASLLRRVFLEDGLACPCGGRRRILSDVTDTSAIAAILAHLGLPTEPPLTARARDPAWCEPA